MPMSTHTFLSSPSFPPSEGLQCVAVCCSVSQRRFQCITTHHCPHPRCCSVLWCVALCCSVCCSVLLLIVALIALIRGVAVCCGCCSMCCSVLLLSIVFILIALIRTIMPIRPRWSLPALPLPHLHPPILPTVYLSLPHVVQCHFLFFATACNTKQERARASERKRERARERGRENKERKCVMERERAPKSERKREREKERDRVRVCV